MNTKYLTSLVLLMVACSGGQTTGGSAGESELQLKKAAADANANHTAQGDACHDHGWYGDGECDRFCAVVDSVDCTPTSGNGSGSGGGVVCAAFVEQANGLCSRRADDPCISQDPDCANVVCTAIAKEADGKCDTSDPCAFYQDPDCAAVDPLPTNPPGDDPIACPAIAQEADGVCPPYDAKDVCQFYSDPDCAAVDPLPPGSEPSDPGTPSCKIAPSPADGVCSREPNDPCLAADPDCVPVACAAYIELSDGECKREPSDPCIFQDPDCHVK